MRKRRTGLTESLDQTVPEASTSFGPFNYRNIYC